MIEIEIEIPVDLVVASIEVTVVVASSPDGVELIVGVVPAPVFAVVAVVAAWTHWLLLLKRSPVLQRSPLKICSRSWRRFSGVVGIPNY